MSDRHDDLDIPSIVPERDELASHRQRPRGNSIPEAPVQHEVVRAGTSGGVVFMLTVLFLGLLASGAAGYVFYTQGQETLAQLHDAENRIAALESTLSAVGEDSEQTTLGLLQRIETNFSEIDKLWAARNQNRNDIADLKTAVEGQSSTLGALETAVTSQGNMINEANAALGAIRTHVDSIASNIDGLETASRRLATFETELDELDTALESLRGSLTPRLNATEQDIESINVYRLQLNQTISTMQQNIRQLQERLGQ